MEPAAAPSDGLDSSTRVAPRGLNLAAATVDPTAATTRSPRGTTVQAPKGVGFGSSYIPSRPAPGGLLPPLPAALLGARARKQRRGSVLTVANMFPDEEESEGAEGQRDNNAASVRDAMMGGGGGGLPQDVDDESSDGGRYSSGRSSPSAAVAIANRTLLLPPLQRSAVMPLLPTGVSEGGGRGGDASPLSSASGDRGRISLGMRSRSVCDQYHDSGSRSHLNPLPATSVNDEASLTMMRTRRQQGSAASGAGAADNDRISGGMDAAVGPAERAMMRSLTSSPQPPPDSSIPSGSSRRPLPRKNQSMADLRSNSSSVAVHGSNIGGRGWREAIKESAARAPSRLQAAALASAGRVTNGVDDIDGSATESAPLLASPFLGQMRRNLLPGWESEAMRLTPADDEFGQACGIADKSSPGTVGAISRRLPHPLSRGLSEGLVKLPSDAVAMDPKNPAVDYSLSGATGAGSTATDWRNIIAGSVVTMRRNSTVMSRQACIDE